jgi:hypothetical protein
MRLEPLADRWDAHTFRMTAEPPSTPHYCGVFLPRLAPRRGPKTQGGKCGEQNHLVRESCWDSRTETDKTKPKAKHNYRGSWRSARPPGHVSEMSPIVWSPSTIVRVPAAIFSAHVEDRDPASALSPRLCGGRHRRWTLESLPFTGLIITAPRRAEKSSKARILALPMTY